MLLLSIQLLQSIPDPIQPPGPAGSGGLGFHLVPHRKASEIIRAVRRPVVQRMILERLRFLIVFFPVVFQRLEARGAA